MRGLSFASVLVLAAACGSVPAAPDANAELCFDGMDNDGNGLADCADPGCDPTAVCVPSSATQTAGVTVGENDPCPAGFTGGETIIHRGLQQGECVGCGCTPGETTCSATVWIYADSNACDADVSLSGGTPLEFNLTSACSYDQTDGMPGDLLSNQLHGLRVDIVPSTTCSVSGTAVPGPSAWDTTSKFCRASGTASGCATGSACVARAASADEQCAISEATSCDGGFSITQSDWYQGFEDQRTCGGCSCVATGGDCASVLVSIGSDYTCINNGQVGDDMKYCIPGFGVYSPPAQLVGTPTPPTSCAASATVTGGIAFTGQMTLCCGPS